MRVKEKQLVTNNMELLDLLLDHDINAINILSIGELRMLASSHTKSWNFQQHLLPDGKIVAYQLRLTVVELQPQV